MNNLKPPISEETRVTTNSATVMGNVYLDFENFEKCCKNKFSF